MAVIKRGILGGFKGSVANVVGTSWKGRAVMKSKPLSVANPRTAGQVTQRNKFSAITSVASSMLPTWVKPLWDRFSGDISGYNNFVKTNIGYITSPTVLNLINWQFSKGNLFKDEIVSIEGKTVGSDEIQIVFTGDAGSNGLSSDLAYGQVIDATTGLLLGAGTAAVRGDGVVQVLLEKAATSGQTMIAVLSFIRADGSLVSDSNATSFIIS